MINNNMCYMLVIFFLIPYMQPNETNANKLVKNQDDVQQALIFVKNIEIKIKRLLKSSITTILSNMMKMEEEVNISPSCKKTAIVFLRDLIAMKEWPIKLLDAFGKLPAGISSGTIWMRGDYDQCINIKINGNQEIIHGKYCALIMADFEIKPQIIDKILEFQNSSLLRLLKNLTKPQKLSNLLEFMNYSEIRPRFDVCIPSSCSKNDLENAINWVFRDLVPIRIDFCTTKEEVTEYSTPQLICLIIFSLFVIWLGLATILEILLKLNFITLNMCKGIKLKYIIMASPFKSVHKIFTINYGERTRWICGMKIILLCVVVFGHQILTLVIVSTAGEKYINLVDLMNNLSYGLTFHATITIETFFFFSSFLTIYRRGKNRRNSILSYFLDVIKKYIRFTVAICCILAAMIVLPLLGNGPHWNFVIRETSNIKCDWWKFILHIDNITAYELKLQNTTWFIHALIQLQIISLPLFFIQNKWPKIGTTIISFLILGGAITHVSDIFLKKYHAMADKSLNFMKTFRFIKEHYSKPYYSHLSSYLFGWLIAYTLQNRKIIFGKVTLIVAWIGSVTLIILSTFGIRYYLTIFSYEENTLLVFESLAPFMWIIGMAWICVACTTGNGGLINKFLSLRIFMITDRLSVWIYLFHIVVIIYVIGEIRTSIVIAELNLWMLFSFVMILTLIISFIIYVLIESPLTLLASNCIQKKFQRNEIFELKL